MVIVERGFCRYGPGKAYLYSHELNQGDNVRIDGRNSFSTWVWVQPENLDRHCWSAASLFEFQGDVKSAPVVESRLPKSGFARPPEIVSATRDGDQVTIGWAAANYISGEDRRG